MRLSTPLQAACALALACCVTSVSRAQQPAAPPTPDSVHLALARGLLEASGAVDLMLAGIRANLPAQRAATPQVPAEFWTRFESRIVQDAPLLMDSIAVLYARTFTSDELAALTEFHRSPAGVRLRAVQPALVAESAAIGRRWGGRIGAEIQSTLAPE